jgi:hypothetical protein
LSESGFAGFKDFQEYISLLIENFLHRITDIFIDPSFNCIGVECDAPCRRELDRDLADGDRLLIVDSPLTHVRS